MILILFVIRVALSFVELDVLFTSTIRREDTEFLVGDRTVDVLCGFVNEVGNAIECVRTDLECWLIFVI